MFKQFKFSLLITFSAFLIGFTSCDKGSDSPDPVDETQEKYLVWLQIGSWPNTTQYILGTNSLTEGSINLTGHGAEVTGRSDYGIITKGGFYYYHNTTTGRFSKFKYEKELYTPVSEVPFTHLAAVDGFTWINEKTLFLVGTDGDEKKVHYSVVDTETLKITNGVFEMPAIPAGFDYVSLGSIEYTNGKVFMQFGYTGDWPTPWQTKTNIGVIDYATLKYEKTLTDSRSAGPGTNKIWLSSSFVDEKGDAYFATNVEWSNLTNTPAAIYRIKAGTTVLDPNYYADKASIGQDAVGLWHIGNGQAILKYIDRSVTSTHIYGFAVFNLETGKITKKLTEIPFDNDAYMQNVIVENGKVYFITNAETGKDYVYEYNMSTGAVKTGLELIGGYDFILRLDKMR